MPIIVKGNFLENNDWLLGDLLTARNNIDIIIRDLEDNGSTHVDYVEEKLSVSEDIVHRIVNLCKKSRGENNGSKGNEYQSQDD